MLRALSIKTQFSPIHRHIYHGGKPPKFARSFDLEAIHRDSPSYGPLTALHHLNVTTGAAELWLTLLKHDGRVLTAKAGLAQTNLAS